MKLFVLLMFLISTAYAENNCDVRVGSSLGLKVMEFYTGNVIHSKMTLKETTADALYEEFTALQDEGVCNETTPSRKCVLRFEKKANINFISFYRNEERWASWLVKNKTKAQDFVKKMKRVGFCQ